MRKGISSGECHQQKELHMTQGLLSPLCLPLHSLQLRLFPRKFGMPFQISSKSQNEEPNITYIHDSNFGNAYGVLYGRTCK